MTPAIRVEQLSKRYTVHPGGHRTGYRTLRESLASACHAPAQWLGRGLSNRRKRDFWALKDVDFDVRPGEVVGIIGRNGAGKSTLLKILARITKPTTGQVTLHGRVGSLLEVGTGFHPELTGRENIYLNGSILGMRRREIDLKFDQIVDFSGVEQFLDTPVKRYSSGMHVRLAFAVAAHLDPEILIVDEVLAVGDVEFQRKCLGQMQDIARSGRTVLFVSHNIAAVEGLCTRGALMEAGRMAFVGSHLEAIDRYMQAMSAATRNSTYRADNVHAALPVRVHEVSISSDGRTSPGGYPIGAPLDFHIKCTSDTPVPWPALGLGIDNALGQRIVTLHTGFGSGRLPAMTPAGTFEYVCRARGLALVPGEYRIKLSLDREGTPWQVLEQALTLTITPSDFYGNGGRWGKGLVLCEQDWQVRT